MYLAFTNAVFFNETTPPDDTALLWVKGTPKKSFVPTTDLLLGNAEFLQASKQSIEIYEFTSKPAVLAYSEESSQWESCSDGFILVSIDGYVLKTSDGMYLVAR